MANEKQAASGTLKIARYDDELGKQGNLVFSPTWKGCYWPIYLPLDLSLHQIYLSLKKKQWKFHPLSKLRGKKFTSPIQGVSRKSFLQGAVVTILVPEKKSP